MPFLLLFYKAAATIKHVGLITEEDGMVPREEVSPPISRQTLKNREEL